jgi:hypothetical protein
MSVFGSEEARLLLEAGWRQGSTFRADAKIAETLEIMEGTTVIVLSQSCVVVSSDLWKDPRVEIATVEESFEAAFNESDPAAVGKLRTKLNIRLDGHSDGDRYVLDINSRKFMPRELLLNIAQNAPTCSQKQSDRMAGWIARSYTRSAWPNRLVKIFNDTKCKTKLEKALKTKVKTENGEWPLHSFTRSIFAFWKPDAEVEKYELYMDFVCDKEDFANALERVIAEKFKTEEVLVFNDDNLELTVNVFAAEAVFFNDFDGKHRVTEWDVFTDLAEQLD